MLAARHDDDDDDDDDDVECLLKKHFWIWRKYKRLNLANSFTQLLGLRIR